MLIHYAKDRVLAETHTLISSVIAVFGMCLWEEVALDIYFHDFLPSV